MTLEPPPVIGQKRNLYYALLWGLLLLAGVAVLHVFDPVKYHYYPPCTFHQVTGLYCPGCGGLRAVHHLSHGRLAAAFQHHPALLLSLPILALWLLLWAGQWWRTGRVPVSFFQTRYVGFFLGATAALFLVFGVLRNLPWAPLSRLAPQPPVMAPFTGD